MDPLTLPRLEAAHISKLGRFTVPGDGPLTSMFSYGGGGMGVSARGLYIGGYDNAPRTVGEIGVPTVTVTGAVARVLVPPTVVPNITQVAADAMVGGVLLHNGRIIVSAYSDYDASGQVTRSHSVVGLNRWVPVGNRGGGWTGGAMALIPSAWQALLGGSALTGQASLSIISRTSSGPCAWAFSPDQIDTADTPVSSRLLVGYPLDTPLERTVDRQANTLWQRMNTIGCLCIPNGTRTLLFVGVHASGRFYYGESSDHEGDPANGNKGDHAYPYQFKAWAYDLAELLTLPDPAAARPYATWPLPGVTATHAQLRHGGATYDPATGRLYLAPRWGSVCPIEVFQVAVPSGGPVDPPPPPPPPPPVLPATLDVTVTVNGTPYTGTVTR